MKNTPFDHSTCNRCGGSGSYSWNAMHGSTCYGCRGRGWVLTKTGQQAASYYTSLMSKPAHLLKADDSVRLEMYFGTTMASVWCKVVGVEPKGDGHILNAESGRYGTVRHELHKGELVRVAHDADTKATKLRQAVEYQASLI